MILWTTFGTHLAYLDHYTQWYISKNGGNPRLCNWALCETWFCQPHERSTIFFSNWGHKQSIKIMPLLPGNFDVLVTSGL